LAKETLMDTNEQAIRELVARWHRATAAGDVDTVLGLMSEDVVFLVAGRPPMKVAARSRKDCEAFSNRIASIQAVKSRNALLRVTSRIAGLCSPCA
jgi:uncharacterized protein (TIGR02246 family)